ncbi:MAG: hypothetical protein V4679_24145 [Pseudomonadota bacterium]
MDKVIVYMDDAAHAQQILAPLFARGSAGNTHWVLVACAPRMTHRISKWVSHSARENWRAKWADKLFAQVVPSLRAHPDHITMVLAKGPLPELTDKLQADMGSTKAQVVDARRPKLDVAAPDAGTAPVPAGGRWSLPGTLSSLLASLGLLVVLGTE